MNYFRFAATIAICASFYLPVSAEVIDDAPDRNRNQTKFEEFTSADGKLLITEYYDIPAPAPKFGKLRTTIIKVSDTATDRSAIALRFNHESSGKYPRKYVSILDEDEILSLSKALAYIKENQQKIISNAETYTEVKYTSRGGFHAGFYTDPKKKTTGYYMRVGSASVFLRSLTDLDRTVDSAIDTLKKVKS